MKTLNRKRFITLSAIAAGFISLFSFCFGSWTFVQDKDLGFGFQSSKAKPVAYIVGKNEKYSSIEKAVSVANGLDSSKNYIVSLYVDSNKDAVFISNDFTINSNITLLIPFADVADNITEPIRSTKTPDKDNEYAQVTTLAKATIKKTVVVNSNVNITNNGTIEIGGELSGGSGGGDYAGQTAGRYSEIIMCSNSVLKNKGTIECFGYIHDGAYNPISKTVSRSYKEKNGGQIINESGHFNMPFVLRDYRGGAAMVAIYNKIDEYGISAFNQIEIRNVTCLISFDSSSKLTTYANLYTGEWLDGVIRPQMNSTDVRLIGAKESKDAFYLIEPTNQKFKLSAHYNISTQIADIDVYGGAKTNAMSLHVKAAGIKADISTEKVFFPLSFRQRIRLLSGNGVSNPVFTMDQKFKIMPGSYFNVGKGATLNTNQFAVYKRSDFDDTGAQIGWQKYPLKYPGDGSLIGDGRLEVNGKFETNTLVGYCETKEENALVSIKNNTSTVLYEAQSSKMLTLEDPYKIPLNLSLNRLDRYHGNTFSTDNDIAVGNYTSIGKNDNGNNNYGFITDKTLYDIKYSHLTSSSSFDSNLCDMSKNPAEFNRKTNQTLSLPSYKDDLFVSFGFYYDEAKTQPVTTLNNDAFNHLDSNSDLKLFIDWQEKLCNIKYIYKNSNGVDCTSDGLATVNGYKVVNPNDLSDYSIVSEGKAKQEYTFVGWRLKNIEGVLSDKTYKNEEIIDAETLRKFVNNGNATLEAQYTRKNFVYVSIDRGTWKYGINYHSIDEIKIDGKSTMENCYLPSSSVIYIKASAATGFLGANQHSPTVDVKIGNVSFTIQTGKDLIISLSEYSDWIDGENGPITIIGHKN